MSKIDPDVQKAINQVQSVEDTMDAIARMRTCGFTSQSRIATDDLPSSVLRHVLLSAGIRRFGEAGYVHIGMDTSPSMAMTSLAHSGRGG